MMGQVLAPGSLHYGGGQRPEPPVSKDTMTTAGGGGAGATLSLGPKDQKQEGPLLPGASQSGDSGARRRPE